jgi:hypothetical protein
VDLDDEGELQPLQRTEMVDPMEELRIAGLDEAGLFQLGVHPPRIRDEKVEIVDVREAPG